MLNLVSNLLLNIARVKFNVKNNIVLENNFPTQTLKFGIDKLIWHCIEMRNIVVC